MEPIPPEALLADYGPPIRALAGQLRDAVREIAPDALERVRPGWRIIGYDAPSGRRTAYFAWLMPQHEHVHLGFPQGVLMRDPDRRLEGAGITKLARWLTWVPGERIEAGEIEPFVLEALRIVRLTRDERFAAAMAREADGGPVRPR